MPILEQGAPELERNRARIRSNIDALALEWSQARRERQQRRRLDPDDFDRLRQAGYLDACLPANEGGLWRADAGSTQFILGLLRVLAHGDSSVALVAAMHPLVLYTAGWLSQLEAPEPYHDAWAAQRHWICSTVREGAWWGTIQSEPGSGGDLNETRAVARGSPSPSNPLEYRLTGQKHFGSGLGLVSYMITIARPQGEDEPEVFFMDLRGVEWGVTRGARVTAEWDGQGMTATQSHAAEFIDFPVTRLAWPIQSRQRTPRPRIFGGAFAAVVVGIVEVAAETAREQLAKRHATFSAFERMEWARFEVDFWLIQQAYGGVLRAFNNPEQGERDNLLGKIALAELAESALGRLCRVIGGSAFSRHSPFGFWFEDVRALGFLRPPWGLAFDRAFTRSALYRAAAE